jgi:hypothetical protein
MDVQSTSTAELKSMERKNRARAAGWTALETKLREDLEEAVVATKQLLKDSN